MEHSSLFHLIIVVCFNNLGKLFEKSWQMGKLKFKQESQDPRLKKCGICIMHKKWENVWHKPNAN
jgi:hypothetical protein